MTIKAVGFDLDDTLYSRGEFYNFVFNVMEASVIDTETPFTDFYDVFQRHSDIEYEKFIRDGKAKDAYKNDRVIATYKELGFVVTEDDAIIFNSLYLYFRDRIVYRQGVEELFKLLLAKDMELFILTNGPSEDQRNKLKQLNIKKYIPESRWFISDELNSTKPDLEIFGKVEKSLGCTSEELLYIGDNYVNDIVGAKNAGWEAVLLNVHDNYSESEELLIIEQMSDVEKLDLFRG